MERLTNKNEYGYYPIPFEFNGVNGSWDIYEPEELEAQVYRLAEIEDILGDEYDLDRLRELAQADKEGRCVVLPIKEGQTVYCISIDLFENHPPKIFEIAFHITDYYNIGSTVFLTREEAEDALRREQDG